MVCIQPSSELKLHPVPQYGATDGRRKKKRKNFLL
jgi:hypothetical protein